MKAAVHKSQNGASIIHNIHNNYKLGDGAERSLFYWQKSNIPQQLLWVTATVTGDEKHPYRI